MPIGTEIGLRNLVEDTSPKLGGDLQALTRKLTIGDINGVLIVDGTKFAQTGAGIQAAIDALPAGGGMVFLPQGTYTLSASITIKKDGVRLSGVGWSTILNCTAMQDTFIILGDDASANNFHLRDFAIDATNQANPDNFGIENDKNGCGILIDDAAGVGVADGIIENLKISHAKNEAIGAWGRQNNARELWTLITNNTLIDFGHRGIHPHLDHSIKSVNNTLRDSSGANLDSGIRHSHICTGNVLENLVSAHASSSIIYCSHMESIVSDNLIIGCTAAHYAIHGWIGQDYGEIIKSNYILGGDYSAAIQGYAHDVVDGNRIYSLGDISKGISIASGCDDVTVINNHISGVTDYAIHATGARPQITQNIIDDPDAQGANWSISIASGCELAIIKNNYVTAGKYRFERADVLFRDNIPLSQVYDGSGYVQPPYTLSTATPTIKWWMPYILLDAGGNAVDAVLPDPTSWQGEQIQIKAINVTNSCKISPFGAENIDGANQEITFTKLYDAITIRSDGTNWWTTSAYSSGISPLLEDLDVNGFSIVSTADSDIDLAPDGTGHVKVWGSLTVTVTVYATGGSFTNLAATNIASSLVPVDTATFDLGSSAKKWEDAYLSGSLIFGASDYTVTWDGSNAVHTVSAGNFYFDGGKTGFQVSGTYHERVNVGGNLGFDTVAEITEGQKDAISLAEDTGGTLAAGEYHYDIVFVTDEGSSKTIEALYGHDAVPDITVAANAKVILTELPISSDPRVIARTIYRTGVNQVAYIARPIYTIEDNSTTTWTDDGSLTPSGGINYGKLNDTAGAITIANTLYFKAMENNLAIGFRALEIAESYANCAIGSEAGKAVTTANDLTLLGAGAGIAVSSGGINTMIGRIAGGSITSGVNNTYIGAYAMPAAGAYHSRENTYVGKDAGWYGPQGSADNRNTGIGTGAGRYCGGHDNVFLGYRVAYLAAQTQGNSYNIIIGDLSGQNLDGATYNIIIGHDIDLDAPGDDHKLNIGNLIKGDLVAKTLSFDAALTLLERAADPAEPAEGECVVWMSDGTSDQTGVADGDLVVASKVGGVTKVTIIHDHSVGGAWV